MKVPNYAELIQARIPEPIVTAGVISVPENASRKRKLKKFPRNVIVGLTPTQLYCFELKHGWKGVKDPGEPVAVWDRRTFYTTVDGGKWGADIRFIFNNGQELDFEYMTLPGTTDVNAGLLQHLSGRPPV